MRHTKKLYLDRETLRALATNLATARRGVPNYQEQTCSLCHPGCVPPIA